MKFLVLAAATLLALALFAVPGAGTAQVQAVPDTCGNDVIDVPDYGSVFDFTEACYAHDQCYGDIESPLDRQTCDRQFLSDMLASCNEMWPEDLDSRRSCYGVALLYYLGVRAGGGFFLAFSFNINPS